MSNIVAKCFNASLTLVKEFCKKIVIFVKEVFVCTKKAYTYIFSIFKSYFTFKHIKESLDLNRRYSFNYRQQLEVVYTKSIDNLTLKSVLGILIFFAILITDTKHQWLNKYLGLGNLFIIILIITAMYMYLLIIVYRLICRHAYNTADSKITAWSSIVIYSLCHFHTAIATYFGIVILLNGLYNNFEKILTFLIDTSEGVIWLNKILNPLINPGQNQISLTVYLVMSFIVITFISLVSRRLIIEKYFKILTLNEIYKKIDISKHTKFGLTQLLTIFFIVIALINYVINKDRMIIFGPRILTCILATFILHYIDILIIDYKIEKDYRFNYSNLTSS